jgi:hypothetical protein
MAKRDQQFGKNDLSRKRRRGRNRKIYFFTAIFSIFLAGLFFLARLPEFQIKEIIVNWADPIAKTRLQDFIKQELQGNYWLIFSKSNFLIYPRREISEAILKNEPAVLELDLKARLDRNLYADVTERRVSAYFCRYDNECFQMDESGVVFAPQSEAPSLIKYYGWIDGDPIGQNYGPKGFLPELTKLLDGLTDIGLVPFKAEVVSDLEGRIYLEDNQYIIFSPTEKDKVKLIGDLKLLLGELKRKNSGYLPVFDYIDARYGNKIFYKLR